MKIYVAYHDDSPPHAAYTSEQLFDEHEKNCRMKELEITGDFTAETTPSGSFCGGMPPSEQVKRARNE